MRSKTIPGDLPSPSNPLFTKIGSDLINALPAVTPPTITSVSPATLPPSSSPQLITISGTNLGTAATADPLNPARVLGGSCVTVNDSPLEMISTSANQISARIPDNVTPGTMLLQVKSLAVAEQSDPVAIAVKR